MTKLTAKNLIQLIIKEYAKVYDQSKWQAHPKTKWLSTAKVYNICCIDRLNREHLLGNARHYIISKTTTQTKYLRSKKIEIVAKSLNTTPTGVSSKNAIKELIRQRKLQQYIRH